MRGGSRFTIFHQRLIEDYKDYIFTDELDCHLVMALIVPGSRKKFPIFMGHDGSVHCKLIKYGGRDSTKSLILPKDVLITSSSIHIVCIPFFPGH